MIDDAERIEIIFSAVALTHRMRESGFSKSAYSRILRETIHFVWEIRVIPKHSDQRHRSKNAVGVGSEKLDYDHAIPMRLIIEMMLNSWPNKKIVSEIIHEKIHGVLITKEEHTYLREKGLGSKMPENWDGVDWAARYRAAGIEIVKCKDARK